MKDVRIEAAELFSRRDTLQTELRDIDNRLRELRGVYMCEERVWGIDNIRFRKEVTRAI